MRTLFRIALVVAALVAALVPMPASLVEQWYSQGLYPAVQRLITPLSNNVPIALMDPAAVVLLLLAVRRLTWARERGVIRSLLRAMASLIVVSAGAYLVFLALWGFNYRRLGLEQKLAYDPARVTIDSARRLGRDAVQVVNETYPAAHSQGLDVASLETAFASAQQTLGSDRLAVTGVPKKSVVQWYFTRAAIDGMTDPFFLEIILNAELLPIERPFVLAHEWAHLAGYAHEDEANFVAWLACTKGDGLARYSGWLAIYGAVWNGLPRTDRRALSQAMAEGPRNDLEAIRARYERASPAMRTAARDAYDAYLRANRVEEGIANYEAVVRLILGSGGNGWAPALRQP